MTCFPLLLFLQHINYEFNWYSQNFGAQMQTAPESVHTLWGTSFAIAIGIISLICWVGNLQLIENSSTFICDNNRWKYYNSIIAMNAQKANYYGSGIIVNAVTASVFESSIVICVYSFALHIQQPKYNDNHVNYIIRSHVCN